LPDQTSGALLAGVMPKRDSYEWVAALVAAGVVYYVLRSKTAQAGPLMPAGIAPNEVPRVQTVTSRDQMIGAFANEWRLRYFEEPSPELLSLLMAQWALEVARGKSMYNWNPGNLTTHSGAYYLNGDPKYHYKSYSNLYDGIDGLLDWHYNHPPVWSALKSGDARGFGHALKGAGYYEADEGTYSNTLAGLAAEFLPTIRSMMLQVRR